MSVSHKRFYSLEEYFALVKESDQRYEYWHGEIFCMSGGSKEHTFITDNLLTALKLLLGDSNCRVMGSNMAIKVPTAPPFRYADISVACGDLQFEQVNGIDILVNPILIIEVLSDSTAQYDRTAKFQLYKSIASFREYLLVSQKEPCITQFVRQADDNWMPNEVMGLDSNLYLPTLDRTLALSATYDGVLK
jgi:Uma2 family endonuclease